VETILVWGCWNWDEILIRDFMLLLLLIGSVILLKMLNEVWLISELLLYQLPWNMGVLKRKDKVCLSVFELTDETRGIADLV